MKKKVIGITGGIATGKTTVAYMLQDIGYYVINVDVLARELIHDPDIERALQSFTDTALFSNEGFNRRAFAEKLFRDTIFRQRVNAFVHPLLYDALVELLAHRYNPIVFLDIPLLFEAGFERLTHQVLVVYADETISQQRLMERNGLDADTAQLRIKTQMPILEKCARADFVLSNERTKMELRAGLEELLPKMIA